MKKFLIVIAVFILIVVGAFAFAVSRAGSIISEYKPELEKLASDALGSTVTLGELSISIFPSAKVTIDSAKVASIENPEETITVDQVSFDLELFPLLSGNVIITTLDIIAPSITIVREEEGIFIEGLPRATSEETNVESTESTTDTEITVNLKSFTLKNATLLWKNTIGDMDYTVEKLNLNASFNFADNQVVFSDVDGSGTFMKDIEFTYRVDELQYGTIDGIIGLDKLTASALGSNLNVDGSLDQNDTSRTITIASDGLKLDQMTPLFEIFAPAAIEFGVKGTLKPDIKFAFTPTGYLSSGTLKVSELAAGIEDLIGFKNLDGRFDIQADEKNQSMKSRYMKGDLNGAPFQVNMTAATDPTTANLDPVAMDAFGGNSILTTNIKIDDLTYPFTSKLSSNGMRIEQIIPAFAPDMPFAVTGTFKEMSGNITGTLDDNMMPSLKGNARFEFGDGLIKDINLGQQILDSVTDLPFLEGALLDIVPADLKEFINTEHTTLSEVSGTFTLAKEVMTSTDMKIVSDFFMLDAKGTIGLDTRLNLDSIIHFNKDFSADMVSELKELRGLLDSQGRLSFPVKITGIPPELTTTPDLSGVLKTIVKTELKNTIKDELGDLVGDALGDEVGGNLINDLLGGNDQKTSAGKSTSPSMKEKASSVVDQLLDGSTQKEPKKADKTQKKPTVEESILGEVRGLFNRKKKK